MSATSPIPLSRVGSEGTVSRSEALSFQQHLPGLSLGLLLGSVHFTPPSVIVIVVVASVVFGVVVRY